MLEKIVDDPLVDSLLTIPASQSTDFWSFKSSTRRRGAHALLHYPAMMVPHLQGILLDAIKSARPETKSVLDPFVGSGTTLVECMNRGLDFHGIDINPLATLTCLAKSGPYFLSAYETKALQVTARIHSDSSRALYVNFANQEKWIDAEVSVALSRIARAIEGEEALWARRLFWLALARVVRTRSNTRTSTYKLHVRGKSDPAERKDPITLFQAALHRFAGYLEEQQNEWQAAGLLKDGRYVGTVKITLGDTRTALASDQQAYDVVMTSPPYGDNVTTIPYGQYAYLPLKWIAAADIDPSLDTRLLSNTHATDSASLGGSLRRAVERGKELSDKYESARSFWNAIAHNSNGSKRFAAFFSDLEDCIDRVCAVTANRGYQSWTIGSRRIGGVRVPMELILEEMLQARSMSAVARIGRSIHWKKMASRNNLSQTMNSEVVLLVRKASNDGQIKVGR